MSPTHGYDCMLLQNTTSKHRPRPVVPSRRCTTWSACRVRARNHSDQQPPQPPLQVRPTPAPRRRARPRWPWISRRLPVAATGPTSLCRSCTSQCRRRSSACASTARACRRWRRCPEVIEFRYCCNPSSSSLSPRLHVNVFALIVTDALQLNICVISDDDLTGGAPVAAGRQGGVKETVNESYSQSYKQVILLSHCASELQEYSTSQHPSQQK